MRSSASHAGLISVIAGALILALKLVAYFLTGSQAILSDALEGIVNVLAAGTAYAILILSKRPADKNHPYGHGKAEYFSASFEGGLVTFAAILIILAALNALVVGNPLADIGAGLIISGIAGAANLVLGIYLLKSGRRTNSSALVASAHHVMSDVWTTVGSIAGLALVKITGITEFDPAVAIAIGGLLLLTGFKIIRRALGALLDEEDDEILGALSNACNKVQRQGIIKVHHVRVMRSGPYHFVDAHVVVPEFWEIKNAHDEVNAFERDLIHAYAHEGEVHFHIDPCRRRHCANCNLSSCPVRDSDFVGLLPYTREGITAKSL